MTLFWRYKMQNINRPEWTKLNYIGWLAFFKNNDKYRLIIDELSLGTLSEYDKKLITPSIAAFQCGEHSEGLSLKKYAKKFSKLYDENVYNEVIDWFIKEENFHSHYLYVFMKGENIPIRKKNQLDRIFRKIRQCSGIESEIITLVTAEIIALTYYSVLGDATDSKELKKICRQMLHDELPHIVFQSYTISHFKQNISLRMKRRILMETTTIAVYFAFYKFFKKNSCSFSFFRKENLGYLSQSEDIIKQFALADVIKI